MQSELLEQKYIMEFYSFEKYVTLDISLRFPNNDNFHLLEVVESSSF